MHLKHFLKLKTKVKDPSKLIKIAKVIEYFILAKASYHIFQEFKERWTDGEEEADYKFQAAILAMYSYGRVCLHITRGINNGITDPTLIQLRKENSDWAANFIDFRDDGTHPINKKDTYFSEIIQYGNTAPNLTMHLLDKKTLESRKRYVLAPKEDIEHLFNYLEALAEIYINKWL